MSRELFIGLDGEMTGNDPDRGPATGQLPHRLIQIGVAFNATETFSSLIKWPEGTFEWNEEAAKVHNIPIEDVTQDSTLLHPTNPADATDYTLETSLWPNEVDKRLHGWLMEAFARRGVGGRNGVPVGFNVGSFDMPFVRRDLPQTASLFGYRTADLNAMCFMLGNANAKWVNLTGRTKERLGWKAWKSRAKAHAAEVLGEDRSHDAGYDAQQAILAFEWLSEQIAKVT